MASIVAYNPVTKTWGSRPLTTLKSTTVVFMGPYGVPDSPAMTPADLRAFSGPAPVVTGGHGGY